MRDFIEIDKIIPCECDMEFLRVEKYNDEDQIYLSKYRINNSELSIYQRIKLAIQFIFNPKKYDIHGGIILSIENAKILGESLTIQKKD